MSSDNTTLNNVDLIDKIDYSSSKGILKGIKALFNAPQSVSTPYTPPVILSSVNRPGIDASSIAARIIRRQSEAGLISGPLPSGAINPSEIMERIRIEEIVRALMTEMVIDVAIPPGTPLQATGGNVGGPIQVFGTTIGITQGSGMVR